MPELRQSPSGGGGREQRVHFAYVKTAHGKTGYWHAHVAGPCHWFECHTKGKSQPCLHTITCGALTCPQCESTAPVETIGYQPFWRESDGRPTMVIVHDYTREQIDGLRLHTRVVVGRGDDPSDAVWVVPALNPEPRFTTTLAVKRRPADLTDTLLRVWKIPALTQWFIGGTGASEPTKRPPVKVSPNDGKPLDPLMQAAGRRFNLPNATPEQEADYLRAIQEATQRAEKNGKHNGKPPG
jgi:hypothetical protein